MKIKPLARVLIALTAILFIAIAALGLRHGLVAAWTDADTLRTRWLVNQWRDGTGPVYSLPLWQQAHDELQAALERTPDNAQLLDDLGFLDAARALGLGTPAPDSPEFALQQSLLASAVVHYRQATVLRPTFPYTWGYLALAKHHKGENDAELWAAYDKAVRYGRNEAGVQTTLARLAFLYWDTIGTERQGQIRRMVDEASFEPRQKLLDLADQNGIILLNLAP